MVKSVCWWYLCGSIPVTFDQRGTFILLDCLTALDLSSVLITSVISNKVCRKLQ